jgi:hypothetical protein
LNAIPLSILYFQHTKHVQSNPRLLILLAGLLYGLAHLLIQGKGWLYHLYPFCLFLIVLTAVLLLDAIGRDAQRVRVLLFLSLVLLSGLLGLRAVRMGRADNSLERVQPLAAELTRDLSGYGLAKTDTVQTIDNNDGGVNALYRLQIRQPTRFIYDNQFFSYLDQPYIQGLRSEFIQALEHNPPRLIVVFDYSEMPHLGPERLALFPELTALLRNEYRVDKVRDGYTIYVRNASASG